MKFEESQEKYTKRPNQMTKKKKKRDNYQLFTINQRNAARGFIKVPLGRGFIAISVRTEDVSFFLIECSSLFSRTSSPGKPVPRQNNNDSSFDKMIFIQQFKDVPKEHPLLHVNWLLSQPHQSHVANNPGVQILDLYTA